MRPLHPEGSSLRPLVLGGSLVLAVTVCGLGLAAARYREGRAVAGRSALELAEARRLAESIRRLRASGAPARAVVHGEVQLGQVLERALAEVGLRREQLERIDPLPAHRLENADYKQSSTKVVLVDVSLYELVRLVLAVERAEVRLTEMRLGARSREASAWRAELTFSVLIYEPLERR